MVVGWSSRPSRHPPDQDLVGVLSNAISITLYNAKLSLTGRFLDPLCTYPSCSAFSCIWCRSHLNVLRNGTWLRFYQTQSALHITMQRWHLPVTLALTLFAFGFGPGTTGAGAGVVVAADSAGPSCKHVIFTRRHRSHVEPSSPLFVFQVLHTQLFFTHRLQGG